MILKTYISTISKGASVIVLMVALLTTSLHAQYIFNPKTQRILIILDASGSMNAKWQKQSRFELAKDILTTLTDSIYKTNKNIEFGVRVLGHQYHKDLDNCTDSKLEVPFGKNNSLQINTVLNKISPKGQTPLAYSLMQAALDFPKDSIAGHSIIIITDGIETCKGNACDAAKQLAEKRISVRPYIVGLGISDTMLNFYKCVGTVVNAVEENDLSGIISAAVKQALNKTTTQINLLNNNGEPLETNIAYTLYDHSSHKVRYQYVHRLDQRNNPDTIVIDPKGIYDLVVHSIPEVRKDNIELSAGKHNIIALDVPQGILSLEFEGQKLSTLNAVQCIVRRAGSPHILYVQDVGSKNTYLTGKYDLEILTLPRIYVTDVSINQSNATVQKISVPGYLQLNINEPGVASVFIKQNEKMVLIHDFHSITSNQNITLQPGNYLLMYRPDRGKKALRTKTISVRIDPAKTTSISLR